MRKDRPMSDNAQELVNDRPGDKPPLGRRSPLREQAPHPLATGKILIRRIDQKVVVDDEHPQSFLLTPYSRSSRSASRKSYSASRSAIFTLGGQPILKLGRRNGRFSLRASRSPWTRYSVTSADMV